MTVPAQVSRLKNFIIPAFVLAFFAIAGSIALQEVRKDQDIRSRASGTRATESFVCQGKQMCSDGRCVGETWRECKPCPVGKARSAFRISCEKTTYSECTLEDKVCNDK